MAEPGDLDLEALRERLAASRRRGKPFDWAWRDACAALLPSDEPDQMSGPRSCWPRPADVRACSAAPTKPSCA
jgi:hypothetical protein